MLDVNSLPISGSALIGAAGYALISVFATGQLIGERLIEKSNWPAQCERALVSELKSNQPTAPLVPKLDCNSIFGIWFGHEGKQLCRNHGNFNLPFVDQLQAQQKRLAQANERRFTNAAAKTKTRCACAASLTLEKRRVAFGLHAGSLRLMTPTPVQNLSAELATSLHDPACAMKG
jgi:hypothetical protein